MSEMVERVARALCVASGVDPDWTGYQGGPADDARPAWVRCEKQARAAIEAMREPTEPMRIAALNTGLPGSGDPPLYEMIWVNMLDADLGPLKEGF